MTSALPTHRQAFSVACDLVVSMPAPGRVWNVNVIAGAKGRVSKLVALEVPETLAGAAVLSDTAIRSHEIMSMTRSSLNL